MISYELISVYPKDLENTKEIKDIVKHLTTQKNKTYNLETILEFQSFQYSSYMCSTRYDIVMLSENIQLNPKSTVFLSSFIFFLFFARLNWRKTQIGFCRQDERGNGTPGTKVSSEERREQECKQEQRPLLLRDSSGNQEQSLMCQFPEKL